MHFCACLEVQVSKGLDAFNAWVIVLYTESKRIKTDCWRCANFAAFIQAPSRALDRFLLEKKPGYPEAMSDLSTTLSMFQTIERNLNEAVKVMQEEAEGVEKVVVLPGRSRDKWLCSQRIPPCHFEMDHKNRVNAIPTQKSKRLDNWTSLTLIFGIWEI